jgi:diaminohydroxyphosphoribosylaminopyrimidine deaminase/5-amino-6-(5-phosphoribosylamino)uracil reductase
VEAGPIVAAAFVRADLVDEAVLFRSPNTIGPDGIDALEGMSLTALTASPPLVSAGRDAAGIDTVEYLTRAAN